MFNGLRERTGRGSDVPLSRPERADVLRISIKLEVRHQEEPPQQMGDCEGGGKCSLRRKERVALRLR